MDEPETDREFEDYFRSYEASLRGALVGVYGPVDGREAAAEAWTWAWEHWDRIRRLRDPAAYLFRVGQSRTRRIRRRTPVTRMRGVEVCQDSSDFHELQSALDTLSHPQRLCLVLVDAYGWTMAEVAATNNMSKSTVQTHIERARAKMRAALEEVHDG